MRETHGSFFIIPSLHFLPFVADCPEKNDQLLYGKFSGNLYGMKNDRDENKSLFALLFTG